MFDISWGETFVLVGLSATLIGRKDLPRASRFLGVQVGRVVGLLQGARVRADKFAANNELHALQSELRSGLRELDAVKGELAVAASSRGVIGRELRARKLNLGAGQQQLPPPAVPSAATTTGLSSSVTNNGEPSERQLLSGSDYLAAAREAENLSTRYTPPSTSQLAPRSRSVAAVAEEEWEKQGIGFKSIAESGNVSLSKKSVSETTRGSSILSDFLQQSLIHDQYDRAVMEQDEALNGRIDKITKKTDPQKQN